MADEEKPPFDPTQPFEPVAVEKPAFDPTQAFSPASDEDKVKLAQDALATKQQELSAETTGVRMPLVAAPTGVDSLAPAPAVPNLQLATGSGPLGSGQPSYRPVTLTDPSGVVPSSDLRDTAPKLTPDQVRETLKPLGPEVSKAYVDSQLGPPGDESVLNKLLPEFHRGNVEAENNLLHGIGAALNYGRDVINEAVPGFLDQISVHPDFTPLPSDPNSSILSNQAKAVYNQVAGFASGMLSPAMVATFVAGGAVPKLAKPIGAYFLADTVRNIPGAIDAVKESFNTPVGSQERTEAAIQLTALLTFTHLLSKHQFEIKSVPPTGAKTAAEINAEATKIERAQPHESLARTIDPQVQREAAELRAVDAPVLAKAVEETALPNASPHDFSPALRLTNGTEFRGEKGKTHNDIYKANADPELGEIALRAEDPEHGFIDQRDNKFKTRKETADALGLIDEPNIQSERIRELQDANPLLPHSFIPEAGGSLNDVLFHIIQNSKDSSLGALAKKILSLGTETQIGIAPDIVDAKGEYQYDGIYYPKPARAGEANVDAIVIRKGAKTTPEQYHELVMHEALHSASAWLINHPEVEGAKEFSSEIARLRSNVAAHVAGKGEGISDVMQYALQNDHEFVAALAHPEFRDALNKIPDGKQTLLTRFLQALKKALGIEDGSALETAFDRFMQIDPRARTEAGKASEKGAAEKEGIGAKTKKVELTHEQQQERDRKLGEAILAIADDKTLNQVEKAAEYRKAHAEAYPEIAASYKEVGLSTEGRTPEDKVAGDRADTTRGSAEDVAPAAEGGKLATDEENTKGRISERGFRIDTPDARRAFADGIARANRYHPYGAAVEVKPTEFYDDPSNKLFLTPNRLAGAAVTPDGDLVSVFKVPTVHRTDVNGLLAQASEHAIKLDAFDINGKLPELYAKHGFRPAARLPFNDEFAPPKWNYEKLGRPDVVAMVHDPEGKSGLPDSSNYAAVKDQVPVVADYDALLQAQGEAIAKVGKFPTAEEGLAAGKRPRDSVRYFEGYNPSERMLKSGHQGKPRLFDVARQLSREASRSEGGKLTERTPENKARLANSLADEAQFAVGRDGNAVGWYDRKVKATWDHLNELHPELSTDLPKRDLFTALLAVNSNGQDIWANFDRANELYEAYKKTGLIDASSEWGGKNAGAINKGLSVLQTVLDAKGEAGLSEFLRQPMTVREMKKLGYSVPKESMETVLNGAGVFGAKVGSFFSNLSGDFSPVTMDRWFMRTFNRLSGTLTDMNQEALPNQVSRLINVLTDKTKIDGIAAAPVRAQLREIARSIKDGTFDQRTLQDNLDTPLHEFLDKVYRTYVNSRFADRNALNVNVKLLYENIFGVREAPMSGSERTWIREVMQATQEELGKRGIQLNNADLQAVLWYYEKELYAKLHQQPKRGAPADYEMAAKRLLDNARQSGDAGRGELGPAGARRALDEGDAGAGESPATETPGAPEGLAAGKKLKNSDFTEIPDDKVIEESLSKDKQEFVGAHRALPKGTPVGLRIDIPAFERTGNYVVTVHEKASGGKVGKRVGYDGITAVDDPVFFSNERGSEKISQGNAKFPVATVEGEFNPSRKIPTDIDEWTPVGFNPKDHSYFYDKNTGEPVVSGTKAISVGNSVFVENPKYGEKSDYLYAGKKLIKRQIEETTGLRDSQDIVRDEMTKAISRAQAFGLQLKALEEGGEAGRARATAELRAADKWMAADQEQVRQTLTQFVNKTLPPAERGRFIGAITVALKRPDLVRGDPNKLYAQAFKVMQLIETRAEEVYTKNLHTEIRGLHKTLLDSGAVSVEAKDELRKLFADIAVDKITPASAGRLRSLAANRYAEGRKVPAYLQEKLVNLTKTPLEGLSIEELEALRDEAQRIGEFGKDQWKDFKKAREKDQELREVDLARQNTKPIEAMEKTVRDVTPDGWEKIKDKLWNTAASTGSWISVHEKARQFIPHLFDLMDGQRDGWLNRNVLKPFYTASRAYMTDINPVKNRALELSEKHNLTHDDFVNIGLHAHFMQEGTLEELTKFSNDPNLPKMIAEYQKNGLTPGQQALYKFFRETLDANTGTMKEFFANHYNKELEFYEHYFPRSIDSRKSATWRAKRDLWVNPVTKETIDINNVADVVMHIADIQARSRSIRKGFAEARKEGAEIPINLDSMSVFLKHMDDWSYVKNVQPHLNMVGKIANTNLFAGKYGQVGKGLVLDYIDALAKRGQYAKKEFEHALDGVKNRAMVGLLGFRLSQFKHLANYPMGMREAGGANWWARGFAAARSVEGRAFIEKNFPEILQGSGGDVTIREAAQSEGKVSKHAFVIDRILDYGNRSSVALGKYFQQLDEAGHDWSNWDKIPANTDMLNNARASYVRSVGSAEVGDRPLIVTKGTSVGSKTVGTALMAYQSPKMVRWGTLRASLRDYRQGRIGEGSSKLGVLAASSLIEAGVKWGSRAAYIAGASALLSAMGFSHKRKEETESTGKQIALEAVSDFLSSVPSGSIASKFIAGHEYPHAVRDIYGRTDIPPFDMATALKADAGDFLHDPLNAKKAIVLTGDAVTLGGLPASVPLAIGKEMMKETGFGKKKSKKKESASYY